MGPFDDDFNNYDEDEMVKVYPEEYDSIEEYELEHGTYNSPRRKKYDDFDDDEDDDEYEE